MVKTKKVLAVVLSVILLFSCFVVGASALTYSPSMTTGEFKVITTADKAIVAPGDVVTFSIAVDPGSKTDLGGLSTVITYNGNQVTPCDASGNATTDKEAFRTWQNSCAAWTNPAGNVNFSYPVTQLAANFTDEEKAYYTKTAMLAGQVYSAGGATNIAGNGWSPAAGEVYVTFQMKVADSIQPGDEIWVGVHESSFLKGTSYFAPAGTAGRFSNDVYDLTNSMVKLTVASATEPSIIKDGGSQIRFRGISSTGTKADYLGEFDVRTVAKISEADFGAKFTDEATAIDKITDIGFVYARTSKVADFNLEKAKQVAQGADIAGYTKKQISHIQHTAGNDYQFTCLVEKIPDADQTDSLNALAYVCFNGEWIFADAEIFADFTELYGRMPQ